MTEGLYRDQLVPPLHNIYSLYWLPQQQLLQICFT